MGTKKGFLFQDVDASGLIHDNIQSMKLLASIPSSPALDSNSISETAVESTGNPLGAEAARKPGSDQISIYVVHKGDTISDIAKMFDVSVNTIKWGNNMTSNTLKVGETLVILPVSGIKYTVVKGDTLAGIAKKYKGDIDEIIAYNDLEKGSTLAAGSIIIIPDGEITVSSSGTYTSSGSTGLKEYAGYFMRPISGGKRTQGIHGHNGVDLASSYGSNILAAADGEVIISKMGGWNGGYGNYIVVKHSNGTQTLYGHLSSNSVSVGDSVKQGEIIGAMGNSGKSTGVHLHFEVRGAKNPF
jgi:LysM repeat protein